MKPGDWLPGCTSCADSTISASPPGISWARCQRCGAHVTWTVVAADDIPDDPWDWSRIGMAFGRKVAR